ncbi:MAG: AmmeMemoRadiSam system radical SAM enzyme [Candidatus Omnitrophica bacterium]|nr:AmmeMemoRadiSam system radical SAM enzyme [Candidatus Omnitrophota bacterium]
MKEAMFYEKLADQKVHCYLCAHHCQINPEGFGICQVRQNKDGNLYSLIYARVAAANIDPIEKKPLYHFHPGSFAYSIATLGCNFKCGFCQNWQISQDPQKSISLYNPIEPQEVVNSAKSSNCLSIAYTYNEPTVFFEYAYDVARLARIAGLFNIFVTNGYMSKEAIIKIAPYLDAANVDLKSFRQEFYQRNCKAQLTPVLNSIKLLKEFGVWVEVTTLVIPGENDSEAELTDIAKFIYSVDRDIPWHISGFHPDYKFIDHKPTNLETLKKAKAIGEASGLGHVYLGNVVNV